MLFIFPNDYFNPAEPDEHFAREYHAAVDLGHEVAVVSHDALQGGFAAQAVKHIPASDDAVYRGWMLDVDQYKVFVAALPEVQFRTSPNQYLNAHWLIRWQRTFQPFMAETYFGVYKDLDCFRMLCRKLENGPAVLRDYVKSVKPNWDAMYVPDVRDFASSTEVAIKFRELRGDDFTGSWVLRRYEEYLPGEARTWWVDGELKLITSHPDTPEVHPQMRIPAGLPGAVKYLNVRFITVDMTYRDDGEPRVIEIGDGQVSDLPSSTDAHELLRIL